MSFNAAAALEHLNLGGTKTAVIIGGTTGMGAAIARLLGRLGVGHLVVFGRNEERGRQVLAEAEQLSPEGSEIRVDFVRGDLSDVAGMRAAAEALKGVVAGEGIDLLFQCQNGPPTGEIHLNKDGVDSAFAIQAVSRFVLMRVFSTSSTLNPGASVVSVANPGKNLEDLQVDDLSLQKLKSSKLSAFFKQSARDSCVLDSFHFEFAQRHPQCRYLHVNPGLVRSELFTNVFPFPMNWAVSLGLRTFASTPAAFAPVPIYLALAPDGFDVLGESILWDFKALPVQPGAWASVDSNRKAVWDKLLQITHL